MGITSEAHQFLYYRFILKISKPFACKFPFRLDPGCAVEPVIIAKIVFVQQQKNLVAALATKVFISLRNDGFAFVTAVVTKQFFLLNCADGLLILEDTNLSATQNFKHDRNHLSA